jgi:hypothetical protein
MKRGGCGIRLASAVPLCVKTAGREKHPEADTKTRLFRGDVLLELIFDWSLGCSVSARVSLGFQMLIPGYSLWPMRVMITPGLVSMA